MEVTGPKGPAKAKADKAKAEEVEKAGFVGGKVKFSEAGGVHNPNNLPAGEDCSRTLYCNNSYNTYSKAVASIKRVVVVPPPAAFTTGEWGNIFTDTSLSLSLCLSDDPAAMEPNVQRSVGSAGVQHGSYSLVFTIVPVLLALVLH